MLNIGRMGPGAQRYYLDHVAHRTDGPEGYYLDRGEAPGRWIGSGLNAVGLTGEVTREQLTAILAGNHPATGQQLASHPARKVPGFDLTFRAPKSVSLLWALSDDADVASAVQASHDHAVAAAAVAYLESEVLRTRRGAGGVETVAVDGIVGAVFRHRTSRAGDPLLHSHVLAANLGRTVDDGVWRTLDSRRLFAHAKTAGTVYQAALRHQLTTRLGVAWGPVVNGCADLAGVARSWIDAFSKRRQAVVVELARRGESSAAAAQVATLATRDAKTMQPSENALRDRWAVEAEEVGIPDGWWRSLLHDRRPALVDSWDLRRDLVDGEELTERTSSFLRRDVVRKIAEAAPDDVPVHELLHSTDRLLRGGVDSAQIVPLGPSRGPLTSIDWQRPGRDDGRFTTSGLLHLEHHSIRAAVARTADAAGVATPAAVARAIDRRPSLSGEQADLVRRLCRDGHGVAVVVGRAGTGKTHALDAARDAWTASGLRVSGVALAARAGLEMQDAAGIPSTTVARLLHRLDDPARFGSPLQPGQVLVVDEAGMIGTRQLARLLEHAERRRVKVVLVGDPRQLPEIDAGGLFAALARQLPAIELTTNRRQRQPWEAEALDQLRHGSVETALATYDGRGRIVTADTAEAVREQLVADWWQVIQEHPDPGAAVMVALRHTDVDDLNERARQRMAAAGALTGPALHVQELEFRAGDRIVCLRNDRRAGVVNGTRATVTSIGTDGTLDALDDHGRHVHLPETYMRAGLVAHGYAITGHKAQGLTVDHTFVLGSDALYREWGYVAMSRGRESNRLYLHAVDDQPPDAHIPPPTVNPIRDAARRLQRSDAERPVTDRAEEALAALRQREEAARAWLDRSDIQRSLDMRDLLAELIQKRHQHVNAATACADQLEAHGPSLSRRARAERRSLQFRLSEHQRRIGEIDPQIDGLERQLADLPSRALIDRVRDEHRAAQRDLQRVLPAPTPAADTWVIRRARSR